MKVKNQKKYFDLYAKTKQPINFHSKEQQIEAEKALSIGKSVDSMGHGTQEEENMKGMGSGGFSNQRLLTLFRRGGDQEGVLHM